MIIVIQFRSSWYSINGGINLMLYANDLFSSSGEMSEGLIQAGFHILFSSDISEDVELTFK
jgi:site-specific DNA-cytosine methylase